ncbi:GFA family protein [Allosphingosinicella indica]|uniref:Uncharacterized conserved protein n=1 Tax=Allosphingosinicella indica TaxID=941907 RepID=A0A1X7G5M0_9SPHN|nr:GFA family protein [Allosphingosinicella indica]SMF64355.1 Uncharacterized conserved protein [Allosphingosinicella indica]
MAFRGSCHCGKIAYRVDEDAPAKAMACNCSICRRQGNLHHFTTPEKFHLETPRDAITTYLFNKKAIEHHFCSACGCAPFAEGTGPDGKMMVEINLRCAEDIDLDALEITTFDGAHKL